MKRQIPEGVKRDVRRWSRIEQLMIRGQKYRVTQSFRDLDNDRHDRGEEWFFANSSCSPYDNLESIFVFDDEGHEWQIPFDLCDEALATFNNYIERVPGEFREDLFSSARCVDCLLPLDRNAPGRCAHCRLVWSPA
jgi:hypothetical protein